MQKFLRGVTALGLVIFMQFMQSAVATEGLLRSPSLGIHSDPARVDRLLAEVIRATDDYRNLYAAFKMKTVRVRIELLPQSRDRDEALFAVDRVISELRSPYGSSWGLRELVRRETDNIRRLLQNCGDLDSSNLRAALDFMEQVERELRYGQLERAFEHTLAIERALFQYRRENDIDLNRALDALAIVEDRLSDDRLGSYDRERYVADAARSFRDAIMRSKLFRGQQPGHPGYPTPPSYPDEDQTVYPRSLGETLKLSEAVASMVSRERIENANRQLDALISYMSRLNGDSEISVATEYLRNAKNVLADSSRSTWDKVGAIQESMKNFRNAVSRSDAYRRERGIDYRNAEKISLGLTEFFSKSREEARSLLVGDTKGAFRALTITARDDSVQVRRVWIVAENGQGQEVGGSFGLNENRSITVDLDAKGLKLKSIEVTASSANIFGTKGRVELIGIR